MLSSDVVFGDHHLVGATGATVADSVWPADGSAPDVALDPLGYAKDRDTAVRVVDALSSGAELIVAQLNEIDTVAHLFGPTSAESLDRYSRTDAHVGAIIEEIRPAWDEWAVIVVSDHSHEDVVDPEPIDLRAAALRGGHAVEVVDEGAASVVGSTPLGTERWIRHVDGVEDLVRLDNLTVLAWARAGRWFCTVAFPLKGVHGSPRTAPQVALVDGGHPSAAGLKMRISARRPQATDWAGAVAGLLGIAAPADLA